MRITVAPRTVAACAAVGIALATTAGTAPVAFAQDTTNSVSAATIDTSKSGSLTINKFLNPTQYGTPTGNADDTGSGQPLNGVTFTATRINGDITTNEGFAKLAAMTPADAAKNLLSTDVYTGKTVDGTLTLSGMTLGAYLVTETVEGTITNGAGETVTGVIPSAPFIVFVPMTNPTNPTEWNYSPEVNPKNTNLTTEKTVVDRNDNVGDVVEYTINSKIPAIDNTKQKIDTYTVVDRYNTAELGDMKVASVTLVGNGVTRTNVTDFTLGEATPMNDGSGRSQRNIAFGAEALKLFTANPGATVEVKLTATLLAIGENGDGKIVNDALTTGLVGNGDGTTSPFETPEDSVETYLAKLQVNKVNKAGDKLPGATFELYQSASCKASDLKGKTALTVGGKNSWITDDQGQILIDGLHVTDFVDNAPATQDGYCLVETKAPAGYELLTSPIALTFTKASMTTDDAFVPLHTEKVTNVETTSLKLPSTGGMGVALLLLLGAGIIGGGVYAARRNSTQA